MLITDGLRGEHAVIVAELAALEELVADDETPTEVRGRIELIREVIASHAMTEDALLFDPLAGESPAGGPVEKMREDHERLERRFAELLAMENLEAMRRELRATLQLTREHFEREEQMLFPEAERSLGEQTLEELGREWAGRREVHLPRGAR